MDNPKISIITVSYNTAKTIEQTILSVVEQTYENIEYIIIDGGSTDGTVDIIRKYEDRIAYWISEPDEGIYDAMNKGIDVATGEWVYFIGADDCLVDECIITKILPNFEKKIDVVSGDVWIVKDKMKLHIGYNSVYTNSNKFNIDDISRGYCNHHQGLFVKTVLLKKRKFDCRYKIVADYNSFLYLYFDYELTFRYIDDKITFFSDGGLSCSEFSEKISNEEIIDVMRKHNIPINISNKLPLEIFIRELIKKILRNIGCLKYFFLMKGWKKHKCQLKKCRWCDRY